MSYHHKTKHVEFLKWYWDLNLKHVLGYEVNKIENIIRIILLRRPHLLVICDMNSARTLVSSP